MNLQEPQKTTMACMEVWGGNSSTLSEFQVPGLDLLVYSQPTGERNMAGMFIMFLRVHRVELPG